MRLMQIKKTQLQVVNCDGSSGKEMDGVVGFVISGSNGQCTYVSCRYPQDKAILCCEANAILEGLQAAMHMRVQLIIVDSNWQTFWLTELLYHKYFSVIILFWSLLYYSCF